MTDRATYQREWRARNRERLLAGKRADYLANRRQYIDRAAAWARANPERKAEQQRAWERRRDHTGDAEKLRQWRALNPDKRRAQAKRNAERHPDKVRARSQRWYGRHRAEQGAYHRAYYLARRTYLIAQSRQWARDHKAMRAAQARLRRARKANAPGYCSPAAFDARWAYYAGLCWMCGVAATTIDHVKALARGGSEWPANLRPACRPCNSRKGARSWR